MGDVPACSMFVLFLKAKNATFCTLIMRKKINIFKKVSDPDPHYFGRPDHDQSEKLDPDPDPNQSQNSGAVQAQIEAVEDRGHSKWRQGESASNLIRIKPRMEKWQKKFLVLFANCVKMFHFLASHTLSPLL